MRNKDNAPECCQRCRFWPLNMLSCARWQLAYAVNEFKKDVPLIRRTAEKDVQCNEYAPAFENGMQGEEGQP